MLAVCFNYCFEMYEEFVKCCDSFFLRLLFSLVGNGNKLRFLKIWVNRRGRVCIFGKSYRRVLWILVLVGV